jgi:hypothetical protein
MLLLIGFGLDWIAGGCYVSWQYRWLDHKPPLGDE